MVVVAQPSAQIFQKLFTVLHELATWPQKVQMQPYRLRDLLFFPDGMLLRLQTTWLGSMAKVHCWAMWTISPLTCTAAQQLGVHSEHETVPVYQQHFYIIELTPNPTYSWN